MSRSSFILLALGVLLTCLLPAASADAVIHPADVLQSASNAILEVDGAAMAPDGSGGVVFREEVGDVPHVFVDRFLNGQWLGAVQVDTEDAFGASMPAIAAGQGGRLLVVWVQARNVNFKGITEYELMGASLEPGSTGFGQSVIIDPDVGEPNSGDVSAVDPALAMDPAGQAYVVYRVVTDDCNPLVDPVNSLCPVAGTDRLVHVRLARFNYLRWTSLGNVNRALQIAMRNPTVANAPSIGIDRSGEAVVAWQEPDSSGVARIWARRIFGTTLGNVLEASPEAIGGAPVTTDAEAPTVAVSPYGEARIAFRIIGGPGSAVATSQLFVNSLSNAFGLHASQLNGAVAIAGSAQPEVTSPTAALDLRGDYRLAWTQGGGVLVLSGNDQSSGSARSIGAGGLGTALTTINPAGGGTTAWSGSAGGLPVVQARQEYAAGAYQTAQLSGGRPGPVNGLALGGDGEGDALMAWTQGPAGQEEVVGAFAQAPPAPFNADTPSGWVRGSAATVTWEASPDAVSGVHYTVYVDGEVRSSTLDGLSVRLSSRALGDGVHHVQVLATDGSGQQTMTPKRELKIDANPPMLKIRLVAHNRGVQVKVSDSASGVVVKDTRIAFGDGRDENGKATVTHRYARAGTYTIVAVVKDKVGNHATDRLRVRVQ